MTLDLSPLTPARIPEALDLMRTFYTEERLTFLPDRARPALELLLAQPAHGGLWFLEQDGAIRGYFVLTICFSLEFGGRFALLDEFFVLAPHRGAGIGAHAMTRIFEEAERLGVAAVRLEVDRDNQRLQSFYTRSGFIAHDRDLMTHWLRD